MSVNVDVSKLNKDNDKLYAIIVGKDGDEYVAAGTAGMVRLPKDEIDPKIKEGERVYFTSEGELIKTEAKKPAAKERASGVGSAHLSSGADKLRL